MRSFFASHAPSSTCPRGVCTGCTGVVLSSTNALHALRPTPSHFTHTDPFHPHPQSPSVRTTSTQLAKMLARIISSLSSLPSKSLLVTIKLFRGTRSIIGGIALGVLWVFYYSCVTGFMGALFFLKLFSDCSDPKRDAPGPGEPGEPWENDGDKTGVILEVDEFGNYGTYRHFIY